ncbi:MAG TPA: hypothetical protein VFT45_01270 [Longimicrobium sp.]|nr:hypothetical protein [Longimicrobium sp.]
MVNDENFGELLIEGLEEVAAHQRGERPWLRTVRRFAPPRLDGLTVNEPEDDPDSPPEGHAPRNRLRP